jgi:hypothetical protein
MKYISLKTPGSNKYWEIKSKSTCRNTVWLEKRKKARKHAHLCRIDRIKIMISLDLEILVKQRPL